MTTIREGEPLVGRRLTGRVRIVRTSRDDLAFYRYMVLLEERLDRHASVEVVRG